MKELLTALLLTILSTAVLAQDYEKGLEAVRVGNYPSALLEWQPLAENGHTSAQVNLGWMYRNGFGVIQDDAEAVRWYRLAAEQGDAIAQTKLGLMYANGTGVVQDDAEAVRLYRLAAEQGDVIAQTKLGRLYRNGTGVIQDYAEAVRWYRLAAEQGDTIAQSSLGWMYQNGNGVILDYGTAHMWHIIAAANALVTDSEQQDIISDNMTPEQIELLSSLVFEACRSCGDLAGFGSFNSVFERNACDDFGEVVKAA